MSKSAPRIVLWMLLLTAAQPGCQDSPSNTPPNENPQATESPNSEPTSARANREVETKATQEPKVKAPVSLKIVSLQQLQQMISKPRQNLLVCDFWSTSCEPCMREFPHLVELHKQHGKRIDCVSVSLDFAGLPKFPIEKCQAEALEFLEQQQATFSNVIVNQDSLDVLDTMEVGSIPFVDVYREGKLLRRFTVIENRPFTYEKDISPYLEELLAAQN